MPPNEITVEPTEVETVEVETEVSAPEAPTADTVEEDGVLPEGDENPVWSWDNWDGLRDSLPDEHHLAFDKIRAQFDEERNVFDSIFGKDTLFNEEVDYTKYMDRDEHDRLLQEAVDKRVQEITDNLAEFEPHSRAIDSLRGEWAKITEDWEQQSDKAYNLMASMTNELVEANKLAAEYKYAHDYYVEETNKWANNTMEKYGDILNDKNNPQRQWYIDAVKANFDPRAATGLLGAPKQAWIKALSMWKKGLDPESAVKEALSLHPQRGIPKQVTASFVGGHRIREAGSDPVRVSDPNLSDREARKLAFRRASRKINSNGG